MFLTVLKYYEELLKQYVTKTYWKCINFRTKVSFYEILRHDSFFEIILSHKQFLEINIAVIGNVSW